MTPLLASYAISFMHVFCQLFRRADLSRKADAYWKIRSARSPHDLLRAIENLGSDPMIACLLLETVEDCVVRSFLALPTVPAMEKEITEMNQRFITSAKREAELRYITESMRAARMLSVEDLRRLSNSVLLLLEQVK